jgi:hypothetical protein
MSAEQSRSWKIMIPTYLPPVVRYLKFEFIPCWASNTYC